MINAPQKQISWALKTRNPYSSSFLRTMGRVPAARNLRTSSYARSKHLVLVDHTSVDLSAGNHELSYRVSQALKEIGYLADGWDGYDAVPPSDLTIKNVSDFLRMFPQELQPEIEPEKSGAIATYWEAAKNTFCLRVIEDNYWFEIWKDGKKTTSVRLNVALPLFGKALIRELVGTK